jgi:hypothetical protein
LQVPYIFLARNGIDLKDLGKLIAIEYDTAEGSIIIPIYPKVYRVTVVELDRVFKEIENRSRDIVHRERDSYEQCIDRGTRDRYN